jgi:polar amino acid transport system substrate-binding protein
MGYRTHGLARLAVIAVIGAIATAGCGGGTTNDLLAKVKAADKIVMSTDPEYPPQSSLADDGSYEGFDIDVGTEIAKRLGVEIAFETPSWEAITAGSWSGRWDFSVGSMTITTDREKVIAFTNPYYYTPAQMAVLPDSGITSLDGLAGKTVCSGEGTTYDQWLKGTSTTARADSARRRRASRPPRCRPTPTARPVEGRPARLRGLAELGDDRG